MLITPRGPEYWQLFDGFAHTAFRVEVHQDYQDEAVAAFLAGEPKPPMPGKERWTARVRAACAAGKTMSRVHFVPGDRRLTDYMRYELMWSYPPNVEAGEDIRIASLDDMPDDMPVRDFALFDSRHLLWYDYDENRAMIACELEEDPALIVLANHWRDAAMHAGIALQDYLNLAA